MSLGLSLVSSATPEEGLTLTPEGRAHVGKLLSEWGPAGHSGVPGRTLLLLVALAEDLLEASGRAWHLLAAELMAARDAGESMAVAHWLASAMIRPMRAHAHVPLVPACYRYAQDLLHDAPLTADSVPRLSWAALEWFRGFAVFLSALPAPAALPFLDTAVVAWDTMLSAVLAHEPANAAQMTAWFLHLTPYIESRALFMEPRAILTLEDRAVAWRLLLRYAAALFSDARVWRVWWALLAHGQFPAYTDDTNLWEAVWDLHRRLLLVDPLPLHVASVGPTGDRDAAALEVRGRVARALVALYWHGLPAKAHGAAAWFEGVTPRALAARLPPLDSPWLPVWVGLARTVKDHEDRHARHEPSE